MGVWNPEIDLVEQAEDGIDLPIVASIFDGDIARARRALAYMIGEGTLRFVRVHHAAVEEVAPWERPGVLNDDRNWTRDSGRRVAFRVETTQEGWRRTFGG